MAKTVTRRELMGLGLALAASGTGLSSGAFALSVKSLQVDDLYAATYKLLGQRPANPFFASKVFAHIAQHYPVDALNTLSALILKTAEPDMAQALAQNELTGLANEIANIWYSGTVFAGTSEAQVIGYVDNMAWQAIRFSTPQSVCGGHFGHWHKIPTGQTV